VMPRRSPQAKTGNLLNSAVARKRAMA